MRIKLEIIDGWWVGSFINDPMRTYKQKLATVSERSMAWAWNHFLMLKGFISIERALELSKQVPT